MSQRHNLDASRVDADDGAAPANAISDETILDAAYSLMLAAGVRRLTIADIARHAGVSRTTMYRRWPNVESIIAALVTREFARSSVLAVHVDGPYPDGTGRCRLVEDVVALARTIRSHPLLHKIIELDPEFLLPYLLERRGSSTDAEIRLLEEVLRDAVADGSIRDSGVEMQARTIVLIATSFVLSGPVMTDDLDRLDRELADVLDRYLAP